MKPYKNFKNSNGLTLIEVLVSIVILGIIVTSLFRFFPQLLFFSSKVEEQQSAGNIVDLILYEIKQKATEDFISDINGTQGCSNTSLTTIPGDELNLQRDENGRYFYKLNNLRYYPVMTICQTPEEHALGLYRIHVKIFNDNHENPSILTEMFDYLDIGMGE